MDPNTKHLVHIVMRQRTTNKQNILDVCTGICPTLLKEFFFFAMYLTANTDQKSVSPLCELDKYAKSPACILEEAIFDKGQLQKSPNDITKRREHKHSFLAHRPYIFFFHFNRKRVFAYSK